MRYTIIGCGQIGTVIAHIFARKNVEVGIANSRLQNLFRIEQRPSKSCKVLVNMYCATVG